MRVPNIPVGESSDIEVWSDPQSGVSIAFTHSDAPVGEGDTWQAAVADFGRQMEAQGRRAFAKTTPGALL